jgi:hypothetical protein
MDGAAFDAWLEAVRLLTVEQRGKVFSALALAAAADEEEACGVVPSVGCSMEERTAVGLLPGDRDAEAFRIDGMAATGTPPMSPTAPVIAAARRRVESTGCPHCGRGEMPAVCRATAAVTADAHSTA